MIRCYVTNRRAGDVLETVERAVADAVDMIQVREKDMEAGALFDLVRAVLRLARPTPTKVLVNDRLDVALAAGAHGVHLPSNGLPISTVRPLIDLVGVSTHTLEEVQRAEANGADFALFGPVFETPGKTPVGVDPLREATRVAGKMPVLAIGGITSDNTEQVIEAGAAGIAGIRLFQ